MHEDEWRRHQRRLGASDGRAGRQDTMSDQHYQRGYRDGLALRHQVRVERGYEMFSYAPGRWADRTVYQAILGDEVLGEWRKGMLWPYIGDDRGPSLSRYEDWRRAVTAFEASIAAEDRSG